MHLGWNWISYIVGTLYIGYQTQILQKMQFSIFQQSFLWFFFIFFTFEKKLKKLPLWVLSWFFFVVLSEHSKANPTKFQVIWSSFEYTCSYTLCYVNTTRINVFWCMTRGNPSELRPIDPEIDKTFHRARRHIRNPSLHFDYIMTFPDSSNSLHTHDTSHYIMYILYILSILFILIIMIFILIIWLNLLHLMRGPWVNSLHQSSLMTVYAFNILRRKFHMS